MAIKGSRMFLVMLGLGLGVSVACAARTRVVTRVPVATTNSPASSALVGGHEPLVAVAIEPSAVLRGRAGEALEYKVSLKSRSSRTVAIKYATEIVDAKGTPFMEPAVSPTVSAPALATSEAHIATPEGLPDGYFQVRVTAAAADGEEDTVQIREAYLLVQKGTVTPIDAVEWFQVSGANEAHSL
jgi:hypothetical protein